MGRVEIRLLLNTARRFLGVSQVRPREGEAASEFNALRVLDQGRIRIGKWQISAELDVDQPAVIRILNTIDGVAFTSSGTALELQGKRFKSRSASAAVLVEERDGELVVQDSFPEAPPGAEAAIRYFKEKSESN